MTTSDKEMEDYTRPCVRPAILRRNPEFREQLMQMAREWDMRDKYPRIPHSVLLVDTIIASLNGCEGYP